MLCPCVFCLEGDRNVAIQFSVDFDRKGIDNSCLPFSSNFSLSANANIPDNCSKFVDTDIGDGDLWLGCFSLGGGVRGRSRNFDIYSTRPVPGIFKRSISFSNFLINPNIVLIFSPYLEHRFSLSFSSVSSLCTKFLI
jgi:hypothetical protein